MKVRIEAAPGELQEKLGDVVLLLKRASLEKGFIPGIPETHDDRTPRPLDYEVLQGAVARANQRQVQRIKRRLAKRIAQILKG